MLFQEDLSFLSQKGWTSVTYWMFSLELRPEVEIHSINLFRLKVLVKVLQGTGNSGGQWLLIALWDEKPSL